MLNHVTTEVDRGVLIVRLNRADKKNAITAAMYGELADSIARAEGDRDLKVVLITGNGGSFTAGNDLGDFLRQPPLSADSPVNRFITALVSTEVPLVAAVQGVAIGIGTTMLLHFDYVVASRQATFSLPFINLAVVPEAGSSLLLAESCGYRKAAELLMLGEPFAADQAADYGIVSRVCDDGEVFDHALDIAHKLAAKPADALRMTKRLMRRPPEPLTARVQAEGELFRQCLTSPAAQEAFTAFLEKRPPDPSKFD